MSAIQIRLATISDVEAVAILFDEYRQFYEQSANLPLARSFIRKRIENNESEILLAVNEQGNVIGFCQLYPTFCSIDAKPIYTLYDLYVSSISRRSGAATLLLKAAEGLAVTTGKSRMELTTAKTNASAQALYESLGWVQDKVFYAYNKRIEIDR
jgi:ribosomal protein S18 acetylase RimI-like enzyme